MIIFLFILAFLVLIPLPVFTKKINDNYISIKHTKTINGFFVVLVFLSHASSYLTLSNDIFDKSYLFINNKIGQLMVTTFLFYSGYGLFESFKTKGFNYIKSFPKSRFFKIWLQFALAILFFHVYNLVVGKRYGFKTLLLSFIGWGDIGNSNWYIFVTFVFYLLFYFCFTVFKDDSNIKPLLFFTLFSLLFLVFLFFIKESWWWNTLLCFPLGMWYSRFKNKFELFLRGLIYYLVLFSLVVFFIITYLFLRRNPGIISELLSIDFVLIIILISMKVQIRSKPLQFVGAHIFSIYMFQRIPDMIFIKYISNKYLFIFVSFATTLIFSFLFDFLFSIVWERFIIQKCVSVKK